MFKRYSVVIVLLIVLVGTGCFYTVTEGQRGLLLTLGKLAKDPKTNEAYVITPGLHFKLPLVTRVKKLDVRLQTLDVQASSIPTVHQIYMIVDYYAKWLIDNPALYYIRTGGSTLRAQDLLQQTINNDLRAEFGKHTWQDVVSAERAKIMQALKAHANESAKNLGIKIVDVRIKLIELPKAVNESVFKTMRETRNILAQERRSQGRATAEAINARAKADAEVIRANAIAKAAKVRAEGVKTAAKIYADSYGKDLEFYTFYKSLLAYRETFANKSDVLILNPNNQFFKYFNKTSNNSYTKKKSS